MKRIFACLPLLLLASCIPPFSINPLVSEQGRVAEPGLVGRWIASLEDQLDIELKGDLEYRVLYFNKDGRTRYEGRLLRLGQDFFLDLCVSDDTLEEQLHGQAFLPVTPLHFWVRLDLAGDTLKIAYVPVDELAKLLESGQVKCPRAKLSDGVLLTGETPELQELMEQLRDFPESWTDESFERFSKAGE